MVDRVGLATVLAVSAAVLAGCGQRTCVDAQGRPVPGTNCQSSGRVAGGGYHWTSSGGGAGGDSASTGSVARGGFGGTGGEGGGGGGE